jgi:hypothetical protein
MLHATFFLLTTAPDPRIGREPGKEGAKVEAGALDGAVPGGPLVVPVLCCG